MAGGRPTKYDPKYCDMLIDHMNSGLSYESFAGQLGVNRSTLYQWEKDYPEFSDSKSIGKEKLLLFFEKMGLMAMTGKIKNFNASTYIFSAKNKIGWTDKQEVEQTNDVKISIDIDDLKM